jgi:hypothetical protein
MNEREMDNLAYRLLADNFEGYAFELEAAFDEGYRAGYDEVDMDNPYEVGSLNWALWHSGANQGAMDL